MITICFVLEVLLFALAFAVYVVHEAGQAHAESTRAPEHRNRRKRIR